MDRKWFIIIRKQQEGPYSLSDLRNDRRFTPDTLVWKKGFKEWVPARVVPELDEVFKDEPQKKPLADKPKPNVLSTDLGQEQATVAMQQDPYQFFLWILILLLTLLYAYYRLNNG